MSWDKLKHDHVFMMVLCCAIPLLLIAAIAVFGLDAKRYSWLVVLLCPLLMFWMMKDMHGDKEGSCHEGAKETKAKAVK